MNFVLTEKILSNHFKKRNNKKIWVEGEWGLVYLLFIYWGSRAMGDENFVGGLSISQI